MKKLLVAIAAVLTSVALHAQGTVVFDNLSIDTPAPIYIQGTTTGAGTLPGSQAALYADTGAGWTLVPGSVTSFFSNSGPGAAFLSSIAVAIPGVTPGTEATLQVWAWAGSGAFGDQGNTYAGKSPTFTALTGGAGNPPSTPTALNNFPSFEVVPVPEPSTIALGLIGAGALLLRRRK
jgi:hypothetical protein